MRKEPQIFTGIQKQGEPVSSDILDVLDPKEDMGSIMESWRDYMTEGEDSQVVYQGILKLKLDSAQIETVRRLIPVAESRGGVALPDDKLHVTLIHQSILKPHRKELKGQNFPSPEFDISFEEELYECTEGPEKKSWVLYVKNQEDLRGYVNNFMEGLGQPPNPEPDREFHISLANLTGNPTDSIAKVKRGEAKCTKIQ